MSSSDPDRWRRLQDIVDAALDAPEAERTDLLARACAGDSLLLAEAERLLHGCDRAKAFLVRPAAEVAAPLLTIEPAPALRRTPERIGPYRIVSEAGQGGMGTVYLAERDDGQFHKRVALKLMREGARSGVVLRRFLDERQILARLDHPHIARLLDGGATGDGDPYLVMEYIDGMPIDRYCDERRLPLEARLRLFIEVCRAVQYAHQNLVVHRDLKPGNILVTASGEVKLLDFGIAKLLDPLREGAEDGLTRTGMRPMTPEFASPEQLRGEPVTTASDVYALGVLLYLLLSGRHPHPGERRSGYDLERAVIEAEPPPPSAGLRRGARRGHGAARGFHRVSAAAEAAAPPGRSPAPPARAAEEIARSRGLTSDRLARRLRGDLDAIVLRALRKEPRLRYATADQLADDVARHLEGRPVLARRGTRLYGASRLVRRHRVAVAAAVLVALSLLGGATATAWQARVAAIERDRARAEAATSERVSSFLEELFRVSDPAEGRGAIVTARELLDRGSVRIRRELAAEPEAQAALMAVMGRAYGNLGEYARAASLLEATLRTQRAIPDVADADVAETLVELARVRAAQGDLAAAESDAREALRLSGGTRRDGRGVAAAALESLGEILHQKGDLTGAERHLRNALALRRSAAGEADPAVASNLNALAHLLATRGELVAAEPLYREALRIERAALGDEHPDVGTTLNDLAVLLYRRNDYAGSAALMKEALAVQRRVLGDDHPEVAKTINNLAAVLEKQGVLAEAEPLYREALARKRAALGPEHVSVAVSMSNLALLLSNRGEHAEADSLLRESLALRRKLLGPEHPSVATALHNVASQADRRGDRATAERVYREVLAMRLPLLGPDHPDVAATRLALGLLLDEGGNHRDAEPLLREALRVRRLKLSPGAWHTAQAESALGACLLSLGRRAEAEPLLRSGYATLLRERGPDDRATRRARENLERLGSEKSEVRSTGSL